MDDVLNAPNPFTMPTDEQVFVLREEEKRRRLADRERLQNRRVYEKTTWSNRIGSGRAKARIATADGTGDDETAELTAALSATSLDKSKGQQSGYSAAGSPTSGSMGILVTGAKSDGGAVTIETGVDRVPPGSSATSSGADGKGEVMNMATFIAKKREMGLTRMALSTKRHEIRKLEEEAEHAEKKIKQQEEQLEETIRKFEDFLKDNDMKANEAMKKAEHETKGKQEKTAEIKKLSAQIAAISNEKLKYEEQMQNCLRYKKFLDQRTPVVWFRETLCNIEVQRVREELERQLEEVILPKIAENPDPAAVAAEHAAAQAEIDRKVEATRSQLKAKLDDLPDAAVLSELNVLDPDIVPMYFTDPEKILNNFMDIEENNLFLIQNCQETEESLEELKTKFTEDKVQMDEEAGNLKTQIELMKQKIAAEEQKKKVLLQRTNQSRDAKSQEELLRQIEEKVNAIFKDTGFGDNDANLQTLGMLTKIETKLEELRTQIVQLPHDFVSSSMKHRDKERRQRARQKLLDEQRLLREERSQKALARSQAPVKKKVGKTVMWRSRPIDRKKTEEVHLEDEGEDDSEFFQ